MLFRSFIAFELTDEARQYCLAVRKPLILKGISGRWVKPENWHITVNFLENRSMENLQLIAKNISSMHLDLPKICFEISCFKIFGSSCKILTLEMSDINQSSSKIVSEILTKNSLDRDCVSGGTLKLHNYSEWTPHITLMRCKTKQDKKSLREIDLEKKLKTFRFSPKDLAVFTSTLTPSGPIYKKVNI